MTRFLLEHDRPNCIGCAACVAVNPKNWKMCDDNKTDVIGGRGRKDNWQELEIDSAEFEPNKEAAEACPVNVIHLKNMETGEKII